MDGPVTTGQPRRLWDYRPDQVPALSGLLVLVLIPAILMALAALFSGHSPEILGITALALAVLGLLILPLWQLSTSLSRLAVILLYIAAIGGAWLNIGPPVDRFGNFLYGVLLLIPVLIYCVHFLYASGAVDRRYARHAALALLERTSWPEQLEECRTLPEVNQLRQTIGDEPETVLSLLENKQLPVRIAALAALEYRSQWRSNHADIILRLARTATSPFERAAAVRALAATKDRYLVEALAALMTDPAPEVRKAATEAILFDSENRWNWIRFLVHAGLSDIAFAKDGPLQIQGMLPVQALNDLTGWTSEAGVVSARSAQTLIAYYKRALELPQKAEIIDRLRKQVVDPSVAAVLRVEIGQLLMQHSGLGPEQWQLLLDAGQPALLRMTAADEILAKGPSDTAIWALRDLARLQNREIALQIARIVQKRLHVDLGLGETLPQPQSRQAADVTRKVYDWAVTTDAGSPIPAAGSKPEV